MNETTKRTLLEKARAEHRLAQARNDARVTRLYARLIDELHRELWDGAP